MMSTCYGTIGESVTKDNFKTSYRSHYLLLTICLIEDTYIVLSYIKNI